MISRKHAMMVALSIIAVLLLAVLLIQPPQTVQAQATATPTFTLTPSQTPTNTPTLVSTPFPMGAANGLSPVLRCNPGRFPTPEPGDCVQLNGGGTIRGYDLQGNETFLIDATTGNADFAGVVDFGRVTENGSYCAKGAQNVAGSATVSAVTLTALGISTPTWVQVSIAGDITGDAAHVSSTNAAGVVTLKGWNTALTPAPNTTPVAVSWEVCGTQ